MRGKVAFILDLYVLKYLMLGFEPYNQRSI